jgi:tetratricopeptide (TPR) repeat protein/transcriptional regulator with XRE-family HTH domain
VPAVEWPTANELAAVDTVAGLAAVLRQLRRRHARRTGTAELSYRELAARTGWSHATVGEYLSGKTLPPTDRFDTLVRLLGAAPAEQGALATARDRVEERRRGPAGAPGAEEPVPRQLPADVPGFAGRDAELAALDRLVSGAPSATVVVAVTGTGGIGKTALAVHWAHRTAPRFPDGQLYANLRGFHPGGDPVPPTEVIRGFLDALGVPPGRIPAGLDAQAALYRTRIAGRRMLVVLDNARDAEQVRPLLPGTATAAVAVTSRDRLTALVAAGARPLPLDALGPADARAVLERRLGPARLAGDPAGTGALVTACAGLPLALALAAAHAAQRGHPLGALAAEVTSRPAGPGGTGEPGEVGAEIGAVFSWSYAALSPDAARLFRLLGLHPGPDLTVAAAGSLLGAPAHDALAELARASLAAEPAPGRYALHDLLAGYAAGLAGATDGAAGCAAALDRMLDHYLHTAYAANQLLRPERDPIQLPLDPVAAQPLADPEQALGWLRAEHAVLQGAQRLAAVTGRHRRAWQFAWALDAYLDRGGYWRQSAAGWQAALAAADALDDAAARALAHRGLAAARIRLGELDEARRQCDAALAAYAAAGDRASIAHTHNTLAHLCERDGDPAAALEHAERALTLYQSAGHAAGEANALSNTGWYLNLLGRHADALARCEQALARQEKAGDRWGQAAAWDGIGYAQHHLGDHASAAASYRRTIGLARALGDRYGEATTLTHLGDAEQAAGDPAAARAAWREALAILTELGHPDAAGPRGRLAGADAPGSDAPAPG